MGEGGQSCIFNWVALVALLLMFGTVSVDILSSKVLNRPIVASVDYASLLATLVAAFSASQTILLGRHIEVEFVVTRLPIPLRKFLNFISSLLSSAFFLLISVRSVGYARHLYAVREATLTAHIPVYPFVIGMAIACIPPILIYALRAYRDLKEVR